MTLSYKLILFCVLFCTTSSPTFAGDESYFTSLGFSEDGMYYAYLQEGEEDGSGFYWAQADVVDVKNNILVKSVYMNVQELYKDSSNINYDLISTPVNMEIVRNKVIEQAHLKSYEIDTKITGSVLLNRPYTDFSDCKNTVFSFDYWAQGGASASIPLYEIIIEEEPAPVSQKNESCRDWFGSNMFTMYLIRNVNEQTDGSNSIIIHKDEKITFARSCANSYKVAQLIYAQETLVVVVGYQTIGYEGPDYRFMVVTSRINSF